MPSFLSSKRSKVMAVAAAGTLAVAIAASAAAATLPSGAAAAPGSAADAYLAVAAGHQGATRAAQADTMSGAQLVIGTERVRFGLQHSEDLATAKAAAQAAAKAAAAKAADAAARKAAAKQAAATHSTSAAQPTQTVATQQAAEPSGSPQRIAEQMLSQFGWSSSQFSCLEPLWERESGWDVTAENPSSGAYGIPQALSGSLMASAGPDWQTDAATQIRWGFTYIQGRYGSPCGAWAHEEADGWY